MLLAPLLLLLVPGPVVLPAEYVNGRVYVSVRVNDRASAFPVDTGAAISILDTGFAKTVGAQFAESAAAEGVGGKVQASFIKGAICKIGTESQDIRCAVALSPLNVLEGRPFEGILGADFIQRYVVAFDYSNDRVVLNPSPIPYGVEVPCDLDSGRPMISVRLKLGGKDYLAKALVDTGASGALSLTAAFAAKHPELESLPGGKPMEASGGVGGMAEGRYVRADELRIGRQTLRKPLALLSLAKKGNLGEHASYDAVIGGEALRRFTLVADYANKRLIFAPNADVDRPFRDDCSGLAIACTPNDLRRFLVRHVAPGSPASEAGLREGDEIRSIDGRKASDLTLAQLRDALKLAGSTVLIVTKRTTVSLALRALY